MKKKKFPFIKRKEPIQIVGLFLMGALFLTWIMNKVIDLESKTVYLIIVICLIAMSLFWIYTKIKK